MTDLQVREGNRWFVVEPMAKFSVKQAQKEILNWQGAAGEFSLASMHANPVNETYFKVYGNGKEIMVVAALFDTATPFLAPGQTHYDDLELFFDFYHDHLGFFQFQFNASQSGANLFHHLPYPESHSTAFPYVKLNDCQWDTTTLLTTDKDRVHWMVARFDAASIFRKGNVCGFNVGRYRGWLREASSWNFCAGPGFPDPTSFGHLYLKQAPVEVKVSSATLENGAVRLAGTVSSGASFSMDLVDPCGNKVALPIRSSGGCWEAEVQLASEPFGRYRLRPAVQGNAVEPHFLYFDLSPADAKRSFSLGVTYDIPDNFCANYYTPARLEEEMRRFAKWGIDRVYWLEYGPMSPFWNFWIKNAGPSFKACGDLLPVAVKKARESGMEFYGIFKVWDMSFNGHTDAHAPTRKIMDMDNKAFSGMPEIAAHQEWMMQANPAWIKKAAFPVKELTFYSENPIRPVKAGDIKLFVSQANQKFKPYRGRFTIKQGVVKRPHYRYTPAGKVPEAGTVKNWFLTLSGLNIKTPYVALQMGKKPFSVTNYTFTLAEGRSADGSEVPLTFSMSGEAVNGFRFGKDHGGWSMTTAGVLTKRTWAGGYLGLTFQEGTIIPSLLEPSFDGARSIWLDHVRRILDNGADGVDIRILCHHNSCSDWLRYAFAEPVRQEFRKRCGRDVEPREEDYAEVRKIRGDFFTRFLRDARKLTASYGKKLAVHCEARAEATLENDTAMQIHWDWDTWLSEGIMDEITLKYWAADSVFVHEKILPIARRKNIPVHVENQTSDPRSDGRGVEKSEIVLKEGWSAGCAGSIFYEAWGFQMQNSEGRATTRGIGDAMIKKAAETLRQLKS